MQWSPPSRTGGHDRRMGGFTLLELVIVIVLIGILAAVATRGIDHSFERARFEATVDEMDALAGAIVGDPRLVSAGSRTNFGFVGDMGRFPNSLDELINDAGGTWRGPYLAEGFSQDSTGHRNDAWGNSYLYPYQGDDVLLCSPANGDSITLRIASSTGAVLNNTIRGTVTDAQNSPPGSDDLANVTITIAYPLNGAMTTAQTNPAGGGAYTFSGIPMGSHRMSAVHSTLADSVIRYVCVNPGSNPTVDFRFPGVFPGAGGTGESGGSFTYVASSARTFGGGDRHVEFQLVNNSSGNGSYDKLIAEYSSSPAAYYEQVGIDGSTEWSSNNPRAASGDTISVSAQTVAPGQTQTIQYRSFRDAESGGASFVDMSNQHFTITLSDGSVIEFDT